MTDRGFEHAGVSEPADMVSYQQEAEGLKHVEQYTPEV